MNSYHANLKSVTDASILRDALISHQRGDRESAKTLYEFILKRSPHNFDALHLLGVAYLELGEPERAEPLISTAIRLKRTQAEFHCNYGLVLRALGRVKDAVAAFDTAIRLKKKYPAAHINKGVALQDLGRHDEALVSFDRAIAIEPSAVAYMNRGLALRDLKRPQEAIESLEHSLAIDPNLEEAQVNLGSGYAHFGRLEEALQLFADVIRRNPRSVGALNNRGVALRDLGRYEEGLASLSFALKVDGENIEALANKGSLLNDLGKFSEARSFFEKVLQRFPRHIAANWGKAISCLSLGDFQSGWALYEYRIGYAKLGIFPPKTKKPVWDPGHNRQTLLVFDEQGLGDSIFFSSQLTHADVLAPRVIIRVDRRLIDLFSRSFQKLTFISNDSDYESIEFDSYLMLGSLFNALEQKNIDHRRQPVAPYLVADPVKVNEIRKSFSGDKKLLCGLSWRSFRKGIGPEKSLSLLELRSLLELPNIIFINLQYGDVDIEVQEIFNSYGIRLWNAGDIDRTGDIDSIAALIKACDYVVSTSNTTAHLAGALGVPGTILVPRGAGRLFYWNNRVANQSLWYPSLRLIDMSFGENQSLAIDQAVLQLREVSTGFLRPR